MKQKIGIIDSKIGGLHFLKHLQNEFKNEDFLYFDVKYFTKIEERDIVKEIKNLLNFVLSHDLKMLIVSSDLVSTIINEANLKINIPYILTNNSLIDYTNQNYEQKVMLFLAKERVIETSIYSKNLKADQLFTVASDNLSILPEEDEIKTSRSFKEVIATLQQYQKKHVDVLVSGCTNISLLTTEILEVLPKIEIISLRDVLVREMKKIMNNLSLFNPKGRGKIYIITEHDKRTIKMRLKNVSLKVKSITIVPKMT